MDIQNILTLIQAVSDSTLTAFNLEEGNLKLSLRRSSAENAEGAEHMEYAGNVRIAQNMVHDAADTEIGSADMAENAGMDTGNRTGNYAGNSVGNHAGVGEIASDKVVVSPLVGTFYASSAPEAKNFVKVGDTVKKGQVLGIIEAMKLMNEIESEYDGVVEDILVRNEDVVEYGQPLFRIH